MTETTGWDGSLTDSSHRRAIERVILSMHDSLETGMSLDDMSREAFISPFHFNRIFRKMVGIPPGHFLGALRIQAAKRLLASTEERIIDVCLDVGFTSPGTFSRRFKDLVGLAPLQFRRLAVCVEEMAPQPSPRPRLPAPPVESPISGEIGAPEGFCGPIFIGLFETPLPHSRPVGCCYLETAGRFHIPIVADGDYYLLALGFPAGLPPSAYLLGETALRAGSTSQPISIRGGRPTEPLDLNLRSAQLTDPPVLVAIPWLLG